MRRIVLGLLLMMLLANRKTIRVVESIFVAVLILVLGVPRTFRVPISILVSRILVPRIISAII